MKVISEYGPINLKQPHLPRELTCSIPDNRISVSYLTFKD